MESSATLSLPRNVAGQVNVRRMSLLPGGLGPERRSSGSTSLLFRFPIHFKQYMPSAECSVAISSHSVFSRTRARKPRSESSVSVEDSALLVEDEVDDLDFFDGDDLEVDEDDDEFEEDEVIEDAQVFVGDGAAGGGISLAGTWWDKEALAIAEEVCQSLDGKLGIYAFRTLKDATIQVRIEKISPTLSSPTMADIEGFSVAYKAKLDQAELAKSIPENVSLEVSTPGVERVVRIPYDLDRFKDRPMYVKYVSEGAAAGTSSEKDGIFRLVSLDLETKCCCWGLADVKVNREKSGKGRPLSKKQREWRVTTPFDCLRMVRLHSVI